MSYIYSLINISPITDAAYVHVVVPQFEPRKKVASLCVRFRAPEEIIENERIVTNSQTIVVVRVIYLEYPFMAKKTLLHMYLDQMGPTAQFIHVGRISDLYYLT